MWTGAYGGRTRRKYGVLGDKANLAARLMQASSGGILCDDDVFQGAVSRFSFQALSPIMVKGKDEAVRVYRPICRQGQRERMARGTDVPLEEGDGRRPADLDLGGARQDIGQDVASTQLDRLSPCERLTLKVASVIGRDFDVKLLRDVYPVEAERSQLPDVLDALERRGLVEQRATGPERTYAFRSVTTWEAVYATLLFAQRRQLHRSIAEWYEQACPPGKTGYYPALAHHWRRADDPGKAIQYLEKAGQQATADGAYEEAERFYRESLELDADAAVLSNEFYNEKGTMKTADASGH
jgi:hypothetical protein